jgi:hypothetical protein
MGPDGGTTPSSPQLELLHTRVHSQASDKALKFPSSSSFLSAAEAWDVVTSIWGFERRCEDSRAVQKLQLNDAELRHLSAASAGGGLSQAYQSILSLAACPPRDAQAPAGGVSFGAQPPVQKPPVPSAEIAAEFSDDKARAAQQKLPYQPGQFYKGTDQARWVTW